MDSGKYGSSDVFYIVHNPCRLPLQNDLFRFPLLCEFIILGA